MSDATVMDPAATSNGIRATTITATTSTSTSTNNPSNESIHPEAAAPMTLTAPRDYSNDSVTILPPSTLPPSTSSTPPSTSSSTTTTTTTTVPLTNTFSTNTNTTSSTISNLNVAKKKTIPTTTATFKRPSMTQTASTTSLSTIATTSAAVATTTSTSTTTTTNTSTGATSRLRVYKSNTKTWVTREIAALDFLLGIPMQGERNIVHQGWMQQQGYDHLMEETERVKGNNNNNSDWDEEEKTQVLEPPTDSTLPMMSLSNSNASHHGGWWEKWITNPNQKTTTLSQGRSEEEEDELEQPRSLKDMYNNNGTSQDHQQQQQQQHQVVPIHAPGRRLEGDEAFKIQIPLKVDTITRQRTIARLAATREWELQVAHGISKNNSSSKGPLGPASKLSPNQQQQQQQGNHPPLLDGRMFFSASSSYPIGVFSVLKYEPKKEEAARRRQKLEARGGGGTKFFIMPERDWRGISYRALLLHDKKKSDEQQKVLHEKTAVFDRFRSHSDDLTNSHPYHQNNNNNNNSSMQDSLALEYDEFEEMDKEEEEADTYVPGLLDDPEMVQGRHRTVMIGDRVTGCTVASTIQFVKPALLKADLNKQFRERFESWEPPKSQRRFIGARVVDGMYTLMEPGERDQAGNLIDEENGNNSMRKRQGSITSINSADATKETIRMPPSLTLSKIRSIKHQALLAAVKAKLEIGTVALAFVYFERLCLDCRVDKTNRRLSFAACLLLAIKINEAQVGLVMRRDEEAVTSNKGASSTTNKNSKVTSFQTLIRPTKKSSTMFASLLTFFTQDWSLSIKHLFAAEWGVFAALQFRLHATPSQVAFHFKRLLKTLDWNPVTYLGDEMYLYWQQALAREEYLRQERKTRREVRHQKKEQEKIVHLKRELEAAKSREKGSNRNNSSGKVDGEPAVEVIAVLPVSLDIISPTKSKKVSGIGGKLLNRFSGKRAASTDKLLLDVSPKLSKTSPSMPEIAGSFSQNEGADLIISMSDDDGYDGDGNDGNRDDRSVADSTYGGIII